MVIRTSIFIVLMICVGLVPSAHGNPSQQNDGTTRISVTTANEIVPLAVMETDKGVFQRLNFGVSGNYLVASTSDGTSVVWNTDTFESPETIEYGTSELIGDSLVVLTSNGQSIALQSVDGDQVTVIGQHDEAIETVATSPDDAFIATSSADNTVRVWAVESHTEQVRLPAYSGASDTLVFDLTGSILASTNENTLRLWLTTSDNNRQYLVPGMKPIAFSPDGLLMAFREQTNTITVKSMVQIVNEQPQTTVAELVGHRQPINDVAFSPDGSLIATASDDSSISLWSPRDGEEIRILMGHTAPIAKILFNTDGSLLFSAGEDHTIRVWDVTTGDSLAVLAGHQNGVRDLVLNPDETALASTDGVNVIVWGFGEATALPTLANSEADTGDNSPITTSGIVGIAQSSLTAGRDNCPILLGETVLAVGRLANGQMLVYAGGMGCEGAVWVSDIEQIRWQQDRLDSLPVVSLSQPSQSPLFRIVDYEAVCASASASGTLNPSNTPFTAYPPDHLPENLQSTLETGIDVVICHEYSTVTIENCHNIGPGNYSYIYIRKRLDDTIQLVDYVTSAIIAEERFIGADPPACPTTAIRGEGIGDPPLPSTWVNWVSETLTGRPAATRTVVSADTANVRQLPNVNAEILVESTQFTPVNLIGRSEAGDWVLALLPDMTRGWVFTDLLTIAAQTDINQLPVVDGAADTIEIQVR